MLEMVVIMMTSIYTTRLVMLLWWPSILKPLKREKCGLRIPPSHLLVHQESGTSGDDIIWYHILLVHHVVVVIRLPLHTTSCHYM